MMTPDRIRTIRKTRELMEQFRAISVHTAQIDELAKRSKDKELMDLAATVVELANRGKYAARYWIDWNQRIGRIELGE